MTLPWRLAFMLDSNGNDPAGLGGELLAMAEWIRRAAPLDARIRIGARKPQTAPPPSAGSGPRKFRSVDAAIEVTIDADQADALPDLARRIGEKIRPMVDLPRCAAMTGPMHRVLDPKDGDVFLSLAFHRTPGTTSAQFHDWWLNQHARVCVPLMTPELLAYDQVHLDHDHSRIVAEAAGFVDQGYDAYDNLTWADQQSSLRSSADPEIMQAILEDEIGHIDHATYHGNMLDQLYRSW